MTFFSWAHRRPGSLTRWALVAALGVACSVWAAEVEPGRPLPELGLRDQHDRSWAVDPDTRLVLFAPGRKASNVALEVLGAQPPGFLASRRAVYVADMSRMPTLITRTIALPALRQQPFEVGVVLDDRLLSGWPRKDGAVTLIRLEEARVVAVEHVEDAGGLRAALGLP